jgi:hypothetical protein
MWNIIMCSGNVRYVFMGGFESEDEATMVANEYGWHFTDENGFDWSLDLDFEPQPQEVEA